MDEKKTRVEAAVEKVMEVLKDPDRPGRWQVIDEDEVPEDGEAELREALTKAIAGEFAEFTTRPPQPTDETAALMQPKALDLDLKQE